VKVALSGDGGDELFAGYDRYRALHLSQRIPRPVRALLATPALRAAVPGSHPKSTTARIKRYLSTIGLDEARRYSSYVQLFDEPTVAALLSLDDARLPDSLAAIYVMLRGAYDGRPAVEAALATDRATYLPGDLLTKLDRSSMLHALEVRSPFMDPDVVEFASRLTTDQLLKGGPKRMLREAFAADLPDFVFKRRKMGFAVPIGEWFRGELRPMLRDHLFAADSFAKQHFNMPVVERLANEHEQERVDHSQRLYALLMLELWWRLWGK
jgi:asparagine synthase (glutamine-hydrolysing)